MRGTVYRACWCRDPETGNPYHARCPKLKRSDHGKWYARYETEGIGGRRRQPVLGPFKTKDEAEGELADALSDVGGGGTAPDRSVKIGDYLDTYHAGKRNLKPRSKETNEEAFRLYWKPAIGHMRLGDVRDRHVSMVVSAMELINRPVPQNTKREVIEMLHRMIATRADDERRVLPEGEQRRKKSAKPLSPARIERMYAPFRAAMNAAVPKTIKYSPCAGVELPRAGKDRPLPWTPQRVEAFRAALGKRIAKRQEELGGRTLTVAKKQDLWGTPGLRPSKVMVWVPADTGAFLDFIAEERLSPLYTLTAYCGLRRDEILGLDWTEVDLDQGSADVFETGSGSGPKSESGKRTVPLPTPVTDALRAWREQQEAGRLAQGADRPGTGRVFTYPDGRPLTGQYVSERFEVLAYRAGLPPIRFHDLRHGAASPAKAAGLDTKYISALLGHSRTSFTDKTYITLFPEIMKSAAEAAAAVVPRKPASAAKGHRRTR
jgi:integrase